MQVLNNLKINGTIQSSNDIILSKQGNYQQDGIKITPDGMETKNNYSISSNGNLILSVGNDYNIRCYGTTRVDDFVSTNAEISNLDVTNKIITKNLDVTNNFTGGTATLTSLNTLSSITSQGAVYGKSIIQGTEIQLVQNGQKSYSLKNSSVVGGVFNYQRDKYLISYNKSNGRISLGGYQIYGGTGNYLFKYYDFDTNRITLKNNSSSVYNNAVAIDGYTLIGIVGILLHNDGGVVNLIDYEFNGNQIRVGLRNNTTTQATNVYATVTCLFIRHQF